MRVARIENQRLTRRERVPKETGEARIPAFRHSRGVPRGRFFLRVVINVEVFGLEQPEVETVVMNLVATEVLRLRAARRTKQRHHTDDCRRRVPDHGHPWVWA